MDKKEIPPMEPIKGLYAIYKDEKYYVFAIHKVPRATYYSIGKRGTQSNLRVREELIKIIDEQGYL